MSSSYYITGIEKAMRRLGVNPDTDQAYNQIFTEHDDRRFRQRLQSFYNFMMKELDEAESMSNRTLKRRGSRDLMK